MDDMFANYESENDTTGRRKKIERRSSFNQEKTSRRLSGTKAKDGTPDDARRVFLTKKAENEKHRLSSKMQSPGDKIKIRRAIEKRELMKSANRKSFEKKNNIDTRVPSPVDTRVLSKKNSFVELVSLSLSTSDSMTPMTPTTLTTSTTHNHHQRAADTPTSDVSLSEFDFHIEKSKELENNLEEQEMAIVLQRIYRGFSCRKMTTPMLVHAREMLLQEVAAVAAAAAAAELEAAVAAVAAQEAAAAAAAAVAEAAAVEKRKKEAAATKHILRRRQLKAKQSLKRASQVTIARYFRGWTCRQHFVDMQHAAQLLQAATRRHSAFKFVKILRFQVKKKKQSIAIATLLLQTQRRMLHTSITTWKVHTNQFLLEKQAAISIQTSWRRSEQISIYRGLRASAVHIQRLRRGATERWRLRTTAGSMTIQRMFRGVLARGAYQKQVRNLRLCRHRWQRMVPQLVGRVRRERVSIMRRELTATAAAAAAAAAAATVAAATAVAVVVREEQKRGPASVTVEHFKVEPEGYVTYILRVGLTTTTTTSTTTTTTTTNAASDAASASATTTTTNTTTAAAGLMKTRYSEVSALHSLLSSEYNIQTLPTMPPKTWCRSTDMLFLERRKIGLELYLNGLLCNSKIVKNVAMRNFFQNLVQIRGQGRM